MKEHPIILLAEEGYGDHFWYSDILRGIQDQANYRRAMLEYIEFTNEESLCNQMGVIQYPLTSAIVLGYREKWLHDIAMYLNTNRVPVVFPYMSVPYHNVTHAVIDYSRHDLIRDLVFYFQSCNKDKIALYGIKPDSIVDLIKIQQFQDACIEADCITSMSDIYYIAASFDETAELLCRNISGYNAILCASDITALHLIHYLRKKGIRVPQDVFVSGMSNSVIGMLSKPSLTSSTLDFYELGRFAVDAYYSIQRYYNDNVALKYTQTGKIIIRESTGFIPIKPKSQTDIGTMLGSDTTMFDGYYKDDSASAFLKVEAFLQQSDKIDLGIIRGLLSDANRDKIAENLFISKSTFKYHLRRMKTIIGVSSTSELINLLKLVLQ